MSSQQEDDARKAELERLRKEVEADREVIQERWASIHELMDPIRRIKRDSKYRASMNGKTA